jgi:hypothetical protein
VGGSCIQIAQGLNALDANAALGSAILTGNVLGAAVNVVGLFGHNTSPDQEILRGIGQIKAMLGQIRAEMHERFDQVDRSLNTIYATMNDRFDRIDLTLGQLQGDVGSIQTELIDLQAHLNRITQEFTSYVQVGFRRPLIEAISSALDYEKTYRVPMSWDQYLGFHQVFYPFAVYHASDGLSAPWDSRSYDPAAVFDEFNAQPLSGNGNYTFHLLSLIGAPMVTEKIVPNWEDWLEAVLAEIRMAQEWTNHAIRINPDQLHDMARPAYNLLDAVTNISLTTQNGLPRGNYALFSALFAHCRTGGAVLSSRLAEKEQEFKLNISQDPAKRAAFSVIDLWGGPSQSTTYVPVINSISPRPNDLTQGVSTNLSLPENWQVMIPQLCFLSDLLGVDQLKLMWGDYDIVDRHNGPVLYFTILGGCGICYGTVGSLQIAVKVEMNNLVVLNRVYRRPVWHSYPTVTYEWPVPGSSVYGCSCQSSAQFPWRLLLWAWDSTITPTPFRDVFVADSVAQDEATVSANRELLALAADQKLRALQRGSYNYIATTLGQAGPLESAAKDLSGRIALLKSVIEMGFSQSVATNDFLRGLLYGTDRIVDAEVAAALCETGVSQTFQANQNAKVDITRIMEERLSKLEWWITNRLSEVEAQGRAETLIPVESAVRRLEVMITSQENSTNKHSSPTVTFTSPGPGARLTSQDLDLRGNAKDPDRSGIKEVLYWTGFGGVIRTATGTTDWAATTHLIPGSNVVTAFCTDNAGNLSPVRTRIFYYVLNTPIEIQINGEGTVRPTWRGGSVEIGKNYTVRAIPQKGYVFGGWSGSVTSALPVLKFVGQTNLVLTANFGPKTAQ